MNILQISTVVGQMASNCLKGASAKQVILGSLAAVPVVMAGTLTGAGSAEAAALVGEFQFSGGLTTANLTANKVDFKNLLGLDPGFIFVTNQIGSFAPFNSAFIRDLTPLSTTSPGINPFLDLETAILPFGGPDGKDVFQVTKIGGYGLKQSGANVSIDLPFWGQFVNALGEVSKGAGNLTFQVNNSSVADVTARIVSTQGLDVAFSGAAFANVASVPEPTTLAGLGLVGGLLAVSRRRKASQVS
jgi:PEP-CTERM motif